VNAAFYRLPYDTMRDFTFITLTTRTPLVLCAARASARPRRRSSSPMRSGIRAGMSPSPARAAWCGWRPVLFAQRTGIEMTYVPYRGSTQAHPDLMAGRVDIMFDTVPAALPHIQSGALKALATTGRRARAAAAGRADHRRDAAGLRGLDLGHGDGARPTCPRRSSRACMRDHRRGAPARVVERHRTLGAEVVTSARRAGVSSAPRWRNGHCRARGRGAAAIMLNRVAVKKGSRLQLPFFLFLASSCWACWLC
jgi:hypothetical protein